MFLKQPNNSFEIDLITRMPKQSRTLSLHLSSWTRETKYFIAAAEPSIDLRTAVNKTRINKKIN